MISLQLPEDGETEAQVTLGLRRSPRPSGAYTKLLWEARTAEGSEDGNEQGATGVLRFEEPAGEGEGATKPEAPLINGPRGGMERNCGEQRPDHRIVFIKF